MQQKRFLAVTFILFVFISLYSCKKNSATPIPDNSITYDGYTNHTIKIGDQTWMVENFRATHYNDGNLIPHVVTQAGWFDSSANKNIGARCYYGNVMNNSDSATYASTYGALYNFYAISNPNFAPPGGWRVPDTTDWNKLIIALGGNPVNGSDIIVGGKLKEAGTAHWLNPNIADNSSGFTALPGGVRGDGFIRLTEEGYFWTSTSLLDNSRAFCYLLNGDANIRRTDGRKMIATSIRLVKDN